MFFKLTEADSVKNSDGLIQFIKELEAFVSEKGGKVELKNNAFTSQIIFEDDEFKLTLDVSIPLRK